MYLLCLLLSACATRPPAPEPLPGEDLIGCLGDCPPDHVLSAAQERLGRAETALGRTTGPRLVFRQRDASQAVSVSRKASGAWELRVRTPILSALLAGEELRLDAEDLAVAVLAARADRALARGDEEGAYLMASAALSAAASPPVCSGAGLLRYLVWHLGSGGDSERQAEARACLDVCLDAPTTDAGQVPAKAFLSLLQRLVAARGGGWDLEKLPESWQSPEERDERIAGMDEEARVLSGRRAELIGALLEELKASFMEPANVCDETTLARQQEILDRVGRSLVELGRRDLSARHLGLAFSPEGKLEPGYLERFEADMNLPAHAWLRQRHLAGLLLLLAYHRSDPAMARSYCEEYFDELTRRVEQDSWPGAFDRNLRRLNDAFASVGGVCEERAPLQALLQDMLDEAARDPRGRVAVLGVLGGMSLELVQSFLSGQQARLWITLMALKDALIKQRDAMGDTPDDLSFKAVLQVLLSAEPALTGQSAKAKDMLAQAGRDLEGLPFPPAADAPLLARLAPAFHLGVVCINAAAEQLLGDGARAEALLDSAAVLARRNLPVAMAALQAEAHAPAAIELFEGLKQLLREALKGEDMIRDEARAALLAALEQARHSLPAEADWWDLGLGLGGVFCLDMVALVRADALGEKTRAELMGKARFDLEQIVAVGLRRFAEDRQEWDLLRLAPALHRVAEGYLSKGEEGDDWGKSLQAAWPHARPVLEDLDAARDARSRMEILRSQGGLGNLVLEELLILKRLKLVELEQAGANQARDLSKAMEELDEALRGSDRMLLVFTHEMLAVGVLSQMEAGELAMRWYRKALDSARRTPMQRAIHFVELVQVGLLEQMNKPQEAADALQEIITAGDVALGCGKAHEVHALLPQLARLLRNLGQGARAEKALALYEKLVDQGFVGDGKLGSKYQFELGSFYMQLSIELYLANLLQSTGQEGGFQLGMGAQTTSGQREYLTVSAGALSAPRHDRLLDAQLQRAFFALLDGRDAQADSAMQRAFDTLLLIQHGHHLTLDARAASGLEESRKQLYPALLAWTGALAQLRGHSNLGAELMGWAQRLGQEQGLKDPFAIEGSYPPAYLGEFAAREPLRLFLRAWQKTRPELNAWGEDMRRAVAHLQKEQPELVPAWGPVLAEAMHLLALGRAEECAELLKTAPRSQRVELLGGIQEAVLSGKWPTAEFMAAPLARLEEEGFIGEVLWAIQSGLVLAMHDKGPSAAQDMALELLKLDEAKLRPVLRGKLELRLAQLYAKDGRPRQALEMLLAGIRHGQGRSPLADQIQWELLGVERALSLGRYPAGAELLERNLVKLAGLRGWQDPVVFGYQALLAASKVLSEQAPSTEEIKALRVAGAPITGVEHGLEFLRALETASATGQDAKALCAAYIQGVLGGR